MTHSSNPTTELTAYWNVVKPSVLIFDVNETLIDFESMSPLFESIFGKNAFSANGWGTWSCTP